MSTPEQCFIELRPALDDIMRLVKAAPVEDDKKPVLAVMVACHSFGMVLAAFDCDIASEADIRVVTDIIVKAMTQRNRH